MTLFEFASTLALIVVLLFGSAFFSGSETALTAASEARMRALAAKGNTQASAFERLRQSRDMLISSLLIGNNLFNVLATSIATSFLITLFAESGVVLATISMTLILVLFAEVIPKTYAFNHADDFALKVARPVAFLVLLLSPFNIALRWLVRVLIGRGQGSNINREEELRGLIQIHARGAGAEVREQSAMLASVLDLKAVDVDAVMTHRASVAMLEATTPLFQALNEVMDLPYTRLPIYSGKQDNIVGVLHVKALLRALAEFDAAQNKSKNSRQTGGKAGGTNKAKTDPRTIIDIAIEPYFIPETTQLMHQLQAFRNRREHFAVVVDEYGDFRGIVTLEDIIEEIVGDIDDEHDENPTGMAEQSDGSWIVDGHLTIRDLNRTLGWALPHEGVATIAGLILHESRSIPVRGQEFRFHHTRFRILLRQGNRIERVQIWNEQKEGVSS
ncbi:MAG: HlyC/CorC family transporter [Proteobacteria bacterium]|nr:HlyC/CorC family transporter [Pseudomonadota bacterium]